MGAFENAVCVSNEEFDFEIFASIRGIGIFGFQADALIDAQFYGSHTTLVCRELLE